jgi:hypothetical protein
MSLRRRLIVGGTSLRLQVGFVRRAVVLALGISSIALPCVAGTASADSGYGPVAISASSVAVGFDSFVLVRTLSSSGGIVSGRIGRGEFIITVPRHSFSSSVEVVITSPTPKALAADGLPSPVIAVGVAFLNPRTGKNYTGAPRSAVTLTIKDVAIKQGDRVVLVTAPCVYTTMTHATVRIGSVAAAFIGDPNLAVFAPSAVFHPVCRNKK